jgi:hypothetical protein
VLRVELMAFTWITHSSPFAFLVFQLGSCAFVWAGLRPRSLYSASWVAGFIDKYHHAQLLLIIFEEGAYIFFSTYNFILQWALQIM